MIINESFDADYNKLIPGKKRVKKTAYPEDRRSFEHFSHERRHAFELRIARAHSAQDGVKYREGSRGARNETSGLGHKHYHTDLETLLVGRS